MRNEPKNCGEAMIQSSNILNTKRKGLSLPWKLGYCHGEPLFQIHASTNPLKHFHQRVALKQRNKSTDLYKKRKMLTENENRGVHICEDLSVLTAIPSLATATVQIRKEWKMVEAATASRLSLSI